MEDAIESVKEGTFSINRAAKEWNVSRSMLQNRLKGTHPGKVGGQMKFSKDEEDSFAELLMHCGELGVPISKVLFRKVVRNLAISKGRSEEQSVVSEKWYASFIARHKKLASRVAHAQNRGKMRAWTTETAEKWIDKLEVLHRDGYLHNPSGVWNLDESGLLMGEMWSRVVTIKGVEKVETSSNFEPKERLTVLAGGNAAGLMIRPLVLYDGKVNLESRFESTADKVWIGVNKSGWMDDRNFTAFVVEELIPAMTAEKNVIFVDGHSSHVNNLEFLLACKNSPKNIRVAVFPSGQTAKLQPLEKSVFGGVKKRWRRYMRELSAGCFDGLPELCRNTFPQHLIRLFHACRLAETLKSDFLQTGLVPYSPTIIRNTVPKINALMSPPSPEFASPKRRIKAALEEITGTAKEDNETFMTEVDRIGAGLSPAKFAAATYQSSLVQTAPLKRAKRVVQLSTAEGEILTDSGRIKFSKAKQVAKSQQAEDKKPKTKPHLRSYARRSNEQPGPRRRSLFPSDVQ